VTARPRLPLHNICTSTTIAVRLDGSIDSRAPARAGKQAFKDTALRRLLECVAPQYCQDLRINGSGESSARGRHPTRGFL
jgi:hypothetical protein